MEEFSARTRATNLETMAAEPVDVLVIGGGIVGAWTALTAAMRGHRTALVEKGDFASGTSGKTSRLVHGGLRYLQKLRIRVVRRAARERDLLLRIAPGLVKPLRFLIPVYRDRGPRGWQLRLGLWLYDALSKEKTLPRRKWLTREEALALEPSLSPAGLVTAAVYADAMTRDARLVLAVIRKAAHAGALVANYARVTELIREKGKVAGARILDAESGVLRTVRAKAVVNATGVWVNELQGEGRKLRLRPTKGIHVLVTRNRIGNREAVTLPTHDGRVIFVLPWGELALVGTTDTEHRGEKDAVEAAPEDVEYLLQVVNEGFPEARLTRADVVASYAGLRPLIDTGERKESNISREHKIIVDPDGLVSVAGGKLTTGRAMATEILRAIENRQRIEEIRSDTARATRLPKRRFREARGREERGDTRRIALEDAGASVDVTNLGPAVARAVRQEMAVHVEDVLLRRTGLFYELADQGVRLAPVVVEAMGAALDWDAGRRAMELARYRGVLGANRKWREGDAHG
jgi:glycerol-3-phosphate dehydrogenase